MTNVAIVGAGLAGLTCAQSLSKHGVNVRVFEKSRGAGGRLSTRRTDAAQFDHGAQYFTVRDPRFERFVKEQVSLGVVAPWHPRTTEPAPEVWYVACPGMSALGRAQAKGLDVVFQTRVVKISKSGADQTWTLAMEDGTSVGGFDAVVLAIPNEQAIVLLEPHAPQWAERMSEVAMLPCWTVMLSTAHALTDLDADLPSSSVIGWWARNSSKPGRPVVSGQHDWVIQSTAQWTQSHLNSNAQEVGTLLISEWGKLLGAKPVVPLFPVQAHRWLYARRTPGCEQIADSLWQSDLGLGLCGDGLSHSRVEHAFLSGAILADRMIDSMSLRGTK